MILTTKASFQEHLNALDKNVEVQLASFLTAATSTLETRLETPFKRSERVSFFSFTNSEANSTDSTIALRLGASFIDETMDVVIMFTESETLMSKNSGTQYTGEFMVDAEAGVVHVPTSIVYAGNFKLSVRFTSGFDVDVDDATLYTNVPDAVKNAALAIATNSFYSQSRINIGNKYNKFNPATLRQTINDCYSQYSRPRGCVVWAKVTKELQVI